MEHQNSHCVWLSLIILKYIRMVMTNVETMVRAGDHFSHFCNTFRYNMEHGEN
jgi:hypothetical protein